MRRSPRRAHPKRFPRPGLLSRSDTNMVATQQKYTDGNNRERRELASSGHFLCSSLCYRDIPITTHLRHLSAHTCLPAAPYGSVFGPLLERSKVRLTEVRQLAQWGHVMNPVQWGSQGLSSALAGSYPSSFCHLMLHSDCRE